MRFTRSHNTRASCSIPQSIAGRGPVLRAKGSVLGALADNDRNGLGESTLREDVRTVGERGSSPTT